MTRKVLAATALAAGLQMSAAAAPGACPTYVPLFGLMPFLMKIGILPKVTQATSIAPADASDSTVMHVDLADQMQCGKTRLRKIDDVVYNSHALESGKSLSLKMDILAPDDGKPHPVVLYITGGGFIVAPKEAALDLRTYVAEAGFAVASIEYGTVRDGATYRDGVEEIGEAVRYLRKNAQTYRIDASSIALWGESAGGYLAAMAGTANDPDSAVQAVIVKFGATDTARLADDFDEKSKAETLSSDALIHYIGADPSGKRLDTHISATSANPITRINPRTPPFLIFHGDKDALISPSQTLSLHQALLRNNIESSRYIVAGANHGDLAFIDDKTSGLYWTSKDVTDVMLSFLRKHLNSASD